MTDRLTESPPIPEARPPHLPDVVTRIAPGFYAFLLVAIIAAWSDIRAWLGDFPIFDPSTLFNLGAQLVPSVVTPLLGAALFLRHPQAHRTMPLLVFGLALFAAGELLDAFERPIRTFLLSLSSPEELVSPADVAFLVFTSLLSLFALLYVGAGLAAARRRERVPAERPLLIWVVALAIVSGVLSLAVIAQVQLDAYSPFMLIQLALGLLLSLLLTLGWAYVLASSLGGWLAAEEPRRAWALAAIALVVLFAIRLIGSALSVLPVTGAFSYGQVLLVGSTVAWILLLVAFMLGLPAPSESDSVHEADSTVDPLVVTPPGSAAG